MLPPTSECVDIPYRVRSQLQDRMSVVLDQALVATGDSIDLLDTLYACIVRPRMTSLIRKCCNFPILRKNSRFRDFAENSAIDSEVFRHGEFLRNRNFSARIKSLQHFRRSRALRKIPTPSLGKPVSGKDALLTFLASL